jgi:hypothetical protein
VLLLLNNADLFYHAKHSLLGVTMVHADLPATNAHKLQLAHHLEATDAHLASAHLVLTSAHLMLMDALLDSVEDAKRLDNVLVTRLKMS